MTNSELIQLAILAAIVIALVGGQFTNFILLRRQQREQRHDDKNDRYYRRYGFYGHTSFETQLRDYLLVYIGQVEFSRGITLTFAAREMLIIPIMEAAQSNAERKFDIQEATRSIDDLITSIAEGGGRPRERPQDAKSVVRAFFKRFCNIPPFCDGEGPGRQ